MSLLQNDNWMEYARENYEAAIDKEDWAQANAVVQDMFDSGFSQAAIILAKDLLKQKMVNAI